jgi:hypothetical protein
MPKNSRLEESILRAYEIIGRATPIKADCGLLCGAACCKDADSPARNAVPSGADPDDPDSSVSYDPMGMILFPGEYGLMSHEPGYRLFRIFFMDIPVWFLVCEGICNRKKRPLACRIFPLAPHIGGDGGVYALPDPRAGRMCPLADGENLDPGFRRAVSKAFRHLSREPEILEYMRLLSADLDEMRKFTSLFKLNLKL